MKAFFNEELIDADKIAISPEDLIVQRGFGVFDFFRIVSGKPLFMKDHLNRFIKSAELARIPLRWNINDITKKISQLLEINQQETGGVKLMLTGGVSPMGFEIISPNLIITQSLAKSPSAEQFEQGSKLITHEYIRELPLIKTTNYFTSVWLFDEMQKYDAIDVLYHHNELVYELSRSNLFIVKDGIIATPETDVLQGITRSKVLMLSEEMMKVQVRNIDLLELKQADEVFISSTLKKVMPIVEIDENPVGNGRPGYITNQIMNAFENYVKAVTY